MSGTTHSKTLTIVNERGMHARPSAKFVECAGGFDAQISVTCNGETVPGTSIMGLLMFGASAGTAIEVTAKGPDAVEALEALERLVASGFGEGSDPAGAQE